jgi:hypothetical protein
MPYFVAQMARPDIPNVLNNDKILPPTHFTRIGCGAWIIKVSA